MTAARELAEAALVALGRRWLYVAVLLAGVAVLAALERRLPPRARWPYLAGLSLIALTLALGVCWLCDDAFISFRYADNFSRGWGLVFNRGEWVEGYTNFFWVVVLAALARLGGDIPHVALVLDLACLVAAIALVAATVQRLVPSARFSFAALALAVSAAFTTYGTSGLETMPLAALVALAMWLCSRDAPPWRVALVLAIAALTRPDQVLFGAAMGLALLLERLRAPWKQLALYAAPFLALFVPYWLWRWHAYGDFYPNTYYAKSAGEPYWSQGVLYSLDFWLTTGAAFALAAICIGMSRSRLSLFAAASALLWGLYVTRVGGDFMEQRFYVPLLPVLAVAAELAARERGRSAAAFAACALALGGARLELVEAGQVRWGLAAENTYYAVSRLAPLRVNSYLFDESMLLARTLTARGTPARYATGCVGMIGYYSGIPLTDLFGLVDREVAHQPIPRRGRPGHERFASLEHVLAQHVDLASTPFWPGQDASTEIALGGHRLWLVRWAPEVVEAFRAEGAHVPDLAKELAWAATWDDRERVAAQLTFYRRFGVPGPLLAPLEARLAELLEDARE